MEIDQKKIYDEIAGKLIDSFFNGYNGTIMAYGQTGSGKTFTMGNSMEAKEEIKGIIPRTIDEVAATYQVFRRIEELQSQFIFIVRATYVEIYNEEIYDLLASNGAQKFARNKSHALSMKEEKDGSIVICGVTEEKIDDKEMLYLLLEQGNRRRSVGSTAMNDESSRSHAIFTIIIEKNSVSDEKDFVCARFSFVDLAGSERLGRTEAVGKSMKEGININKGLLALGNVISALTDDTGKVTFIPYRVSKLTRILRNSLGGNSRTWMIACVSPVLADLDESLNTIKYATRARKIANTPIVNKDPQSAIITQLKQQIFKLQSDLSKMKRIIHQNGLVGQLNELEDDLTEETGSIPGPSKEKDRILSRRETTLDIETMGDTDYRLKQAEKEILKLKEQRDTVKKDLNEKNILYLKIIGRVAELRNQNQQLSDALEKSLAKLRGEAIEGVVEVAAAVLATSLKKDSNDEVISLVREVENLRLKLAEKSKYSSTLEDEYTKLLKISTKENELLVEKVREISELQRQLKKHERASISRDSNNYDIPLLTTKSNLTEGGSGLEDSNFAVDASTTQDQIVEEKDTEVYFKEKEENELEIKKLMENLVEKEAQLRSMMEIDRDEEMMEIEMLTEKEVASLDRLTDLEQQLMELQKERDDALKKATQDSTGNLRQSFEGDKHMDFLKKTARKNSEAFVNKEAEIVGKYKVKVSLLEQQIHEMKKKDNDSKQFDSKLKEKNEKIDLLMGEINKMKTQKIDLDKKLREGSQSLAKSKLEKQKEILNVKKELFKKSAEINRLKNLTRKQDLSFHKKLSELKKSGGALHFTKKNTKKVTSSTFEDIDLEGFSQLMTVFCQKIFEHVELESELEAQTNTLAKYHTKLDELFEEISRLEVQRQLSSEEEIQEEIGLIEEKQKEFEASMSSCEDTIKIKKSYIARMEADLEYLREFIDEGFASLLTFLSQDATNKEAFWEAALNVMMVELEGLKRTQVGGCASVKQAEADVAGFKKNFNDNRNAISNLEQEVER